MQFTDRLPIFAARRIRPAQRPSSDAHLRRKLDRLNQALDGALKLAGADVYDAGVDFHRQAERIGALG